MLSGFFPLEESCAKDPRFAALLAAQCQGQTTTHTVYGWYKQSYAHLSAAAVELIDGMLIMNPAQRLELPDVLRHRWLDDPVVPNAPVDFGEDGFDEGPRYRSLSSASCKLPRASHKLTTASNKLPTASCKLSRASLKLSSASCKL